MLSILTNTAVALILILCAWGCGRALLAAWPQRFSMRLDLGWPIEFALGLVAISTLLFLMAAARLYRIVPVALLTCGVAVWVLFDWMRRRRRLEVERIDSLGANAAPTVGWRRVVFGVCAAIAGAVLFTLFTQANRPDVAHDAAVYHLWIPERLLEAGGFRTFDWNVYANWPHAVQLVWGQALALGRHEAANLVHLACAVALLLLVAKEAAQSAESQHNSALMSAPALLAAGLLLATPVFLFEARIPYVDIAFALFLCAAFVVFERLEVTSSEASTPAVEPCDPPPREQLDRLFLLCGVLIAGLVSVKLNGFLAAAALLLVASPTLSRLIRSGYLGLRGATLLSMPPLLLGGLWLTKSWVLTGNPVYPMFWDLFGGPNWSSELASQHRHWNQSIGMGRSALDYLLLPWRLLSEADLGYQRFDGKIGWAWGLALPFAALGAWRDRTARRALVTAMLVAILWALTSQQTRLLIPALPLMAIAAGRGVLAFELGGTQLGHRVRVQLAALSCALVFTGVAAASWIYAQQTPRLLADLAQGGSAIRESVIPTTTTWINERTPPGTRVLLLGTNRGFGIDREIVIDSFFEASQISWAFGGDDDAEEARRTARTLGITHVLWTAPAAGVGYPPTLVRLAQRQLAEPRCLVAADESAALLALDCP